MHQQARVIEQGVIVEGVIPTGADIPPDRDIGTGAWTGAGINRSMIHGARPNGIPLAEVIPSALYKLLTPQDIDAITTYLRPAAPDLTPRPPTGAPGISALFASYFKAFTEQAPHLTGAAANAAVQILVRLALAARGGASPIDEPHRDTLRISRIEAVRQFVERNLHQPDITPAHTARAVGVSVRQLHLLFEPSGTSFSRYVLSRRLERARSLLSRHPNQPVYDIMLACGIESSTVFYRGFRRAYGMNPTEYRRTSLDRN